MLNLKHSAAFGYSLLFILIMAIGFYATVTKSNAQNQAFLAVVPATSNVDIGQEFNLTIEIDDIQPPNGVAGVQFEISWDPTILTAINITDVFFTTVGGDNAWRLALSNNSATGIAKYAYTFQDLILARESGYAPILGNHTLAILTLNGTSTGNSPVNIGKIKVGDMDANKVPCTSVNGTVAVGNAAPMIAVSSPANNTVYKTDTVAFAFTTNKPASWVGYSLDGNPNVTVSGPVNIQTPDGRHVLIAYVNDSGGLWGSYGPISFATDTAPPTVSFTYSPSPTVAEYMFGNFRWYLNFTAAASNDSGSGIATYYWDFGDGKNETTNAPSNSVLHLYREPGAYNVMLNVTDFAGFSSTQTQALTLNPGSVPSNLPLELIFAIILPAVWIPALGYYFIRGSRKRKFRKLK